VFDRTSLSKNPSRSRYELVERGAVVGIVDYDDDGEVVVLPHTYIEPPARGRGLAARLVRFALDDLRAEGRTVVPACWFVAQFIDTHPAYQNLLAS
jgi:predicted GNAT family acetyltransferase